MYILLTRKWSTHETLSATHCFKYCSRVSKWDQITNNQRLNSLLKHTFKRHDKCILKRVETNKSKKKKNTHTRETRSVANPISITNANNSDIKVINDNEALSTSNRFITDTSNVARNGSFLNDKVVLSKDEQVVSVPSG